VPAKWAHPSSPPGQTSRSADRVLLTLASMTKSRDMIGSLIADLESARRPPAEGGASSPMKRSKLSRPRRRGAFSLV
jgi:hypothetical protein